MQLVFILILAFIFFFFLNACVSECCKHLALRGLNQGLVQTRKSTGALFSGWLECHTQLSKKAGGEVRFDAEKRKGRVLTRWDDSIFIKYLWMSSSAWREISMHCKACMSGEKEKERKNRKEKRWKHEKKKNETNRTIYLFVMKIQQSPPLSPKKERMVAVPSLGFREKCWKLTLAKVKTHWQWVFPKISCHRPI